MLDQQSSVKINERIEAACKEREAAVREAIDARDTVIYALAADPHWLVFDGELFSAQARPDTTEWWEWEPVAIVRGPGLVQVDDGAWVYCAGELRYGAQELFWKRDVLDGFKVTVTLLNELQDKAIP